MSALLKIEEGGGGEKGLRSQKKESISLQLSPAGGRKGFEGKRPAPVSAFDARGSALKGEKGRRR